MFPPSWRPAPPRSASSLGEPRRLVGPRQRDGPPAQSQLPRLGWAFASCCGLYRLLQGPQAVVRTLLLVFGFSAEALGPFLSAVLLKLPVRVHFQIHVSVSTDSTGGLPLSRAGGNTLRSV